MNDHLSWGSLHRLKSWTSMDFGGCVEDFEPGLYDQLIDELISERLNALARKRLTADIHDVDSAEMPDRLGEVLGRWAHDALAAVPAEQRAEAALALSRSARAAIAGLRTDAVAPDCTLIAPFQRLVAIEKLAATGQPISISRPLTALRETVLMTNARDQPGVGQEIQSEIDSADRIDLVLAFIRWTGIRQLLPHLKRHVEAGKPLRIITTTYTGSTEQRALQALVDLGAQVKVSYDISTTRLHAKAWMFQRASGFSTVYIGSSNLTFSAQVTGLEWNVRAAQHLNPDLIAAFDRTFATYWFDPHFEPFEAERFARATAAAEPDDSILPLFEIEPYPFQRQILERVQVERRKGHPHNLIAAATGTGKTIIAALDYRHLRTELKRARLLFVAHRSEILQQSQATFRRVLSDGEFGELWVGGQRPVLWENVFASIQSINAREATSLDPEQFDVVIVDEFHHAAAASYVALLDHLRPQYLLGLTATPERTDGQDILRWFGDHDSIELRLWDALEQGLLSPFHYFGIHDATDLSGVTWSRGRGYDVAELTNIYTGDDVWASKIIAAVQDKIGDATRMRALGFCVSIKHAQFMADRFNRVGIGAKDLTANTSAADRSQALADLRDGKVQILFTVDLFNEGVDIPAIDVVIMLRPTQSATIFLQQLGRGLRHSEGKDVLTVLDFVGHQNKKFRFDLRYRRLLGCNRRELESNIQQGFPYLPAGCQLDLDEIARDIVFKNISEALPITWQQRIQQLRELGDVSLGQYLYETGLELEDVYRNNRTWTELRRHAGINLTPPASDENKAGKGIARLLHLDDQERIDRYIELLSSKEPPTAAGLAQDERLCRQLEGLLLTVLNPSKNTYRNIDEAAADLWRHDGLRRELLEVLPLLKDQIIHLHRPLGRMHPVPLQVHASYNREEILAAFGQSTVAKPFPLQAGVYWHEKTRTDLLFITLRKSDKDYSPTTRYLDYAISERFFHWESQATTTVTSPRGQNYIHHKARGRTIVLFVRTAKKDPSGRTRPYFCVGPATYVEHQSERPIQITWKLHHLIPGDIFTLYRAAVA